MRPSFPSRRRFLQTATGLLAGVPLLTSRTEGNAGISDRYAVLPGGRYFGEMRIEAVVEDREVFTEGPCYGGFGDIFFTNVPASKILCWNVGSKTLTVFRENSHKTNGLCLTPTGDLLCCQGETGRIVRVSRKTGREFFVADGYNGFPFAAPNDLCLDAAGRIYFSSRPGVTDPAQGNPNAVYRVDPNGSVTQLLSWPDVHMPNGIVTSPDDCTLYVIEAHPDADHNRSILAFDLSPEGTLSNRRTLIDFYPGRSGDGMCIDAQGNLYVAAGLHATRGTSETLDTRPGIHLISPHGELLAFRETPEDTVTNCTFGGTDLRTLYITCGTKLLSLRTSIPGKPGYTPIDFPR